MVLLLLHIQIRRKEFKVKTLKIMLDYIWGPIWKDCYDPETDKVVTGIDIVDNDEEVWKINGQICDLYSSYYETDENGIPRKFDFESEKRDKGRMLELLAKLNARLSEINDGSFEIEDCETPRVKAL